jgi:hypothetical protein
MTKNKKQKIEYVYLVYCNRNPLVYAIYKSQVKAIKYAKSLIEYRKTHAEEKGWKFGFYHYFDLTNPENNIPKFTPTFEHPKPLTIKDYNSEYDIRELTIFSTCLSIKEDAGEYGDDRCLIQVVRRPIQESLEEYYKNIDKTAK